MEVDVWSRGGVHRGSTAATRLTGQQAHGEWRSAARRETLRLCYQLAELGEDAALLFHPVVSFLVSKLEMSDLRTEQINSVSLVDFKVTFFFFFPLDLCSWFWQGNCLMKPLQVC